MDRLRFAELLGNASENPFRESLSKINDKFTYLSEQDCINMHEPCETTHLGLNSRTEEHPVELRAHDREGDVNPHCLRDGSDFETN